MRTHRLLNPIFVIETSRPYSYLTTASECAECADFLSKQSVLAIDLEFDKNRFGYGFTLCLMQIFSGDRCFLIDPLLEEIDVKLLFPVLENPDIKKITFSFGEDIRLLHHIGCFPKGIYDLSFASALLDYPPSSLSNLLLDTLGIDVGKSSQQSNWLHRPITEQQMMYAANDVLHLIRLHDFFEIQIKEKGISEWVREENESFESANYENEIHNTVIKDKDKEDLTFFEWHIFCRLMEYREEKAKELNQASHIVIQKYFLQELARFPKRVSNWMRIRSTSHSLKTDHIQHEVEQILDKAIKEATEQNLSKTKKAIYSQSAEEQQRIHQNNRIVDQAKKQVFKPIQDVLSERVGKNAQTFILSNRLIKDLVHGNLENYLPYKRVLFNEIASKLDIDVTETIGAIRDI